MQHKVVKTGMRRIMRRPYAAINIAAPAHTTTEAQPLASIRLYQILILLDKWSALVARSRPKHLRYRLEMAARGPLSHRLFRFEAERLLEALDADT